MKARRILIGGLPYFGRMLAGLLDGDGWEARYIDPPGGSLATWLAGAQALRQADIIYLIGGQLQRWSRPDVLMRLGKRPVVMHWVGSDVTFARNVVRARRASRALLRSPQHWAEVSWTARELRELGVNAEIVPLTSTRIHADVQPLPPDFTVLTYLPATRPDFYGRELVMRLAAETLEMRFLVVGSTGEGWNAPANVEFLGWRQEMDAVYARSTALLRLPAHDGLSFMVLEALAAGRYVFWNHPLEGVIQVSDANTAWTELQRLLARHRSGRLELNEPGRSAVREHFAPERVRAEILGRFERLMLVSP